MTAMVTSPLPATRYLARCLAPQWHQHLRCGCDCVQKQRIGEPIRCLVRDRRQGGFAELVIGHQPEVFLP